MSKTNRFNEMMAKAELYGAIPIGERTISQHHLVNRAKCILDAMEERPGLEWTFQLDSGVQLYVTKPSGKSYGPKVGDILVLNQCTGFSNSVGCNNADGLGTLVDRDKMRLATPDDAGYKGTRNEWHAVLREENARFRLEAFLAQSTLVFVLGMMLIHHASGGVL